MRSAFATAQDRLGLTPVHRVPQVWGHGGRTLSGLVTTSSGHAWLRLLEVPAGSEGGKVWTGTQQAAAVVPTHVPRPRLLRTTDWAHDAHVYRAELTTYEPTPVCSPTPDLAESISSPTHGGANYARPPTPSARLLFPPGRQPVISQDYIHRTIPRYLGDIGIDTTVLRWSLAHGDLHWANLTSPKLVILDREGFGPAPDGFDAAHLHAYTLPHPDLAARVRRTFADVLTTPHGRLAELVVAAVLLQAADRDPIHARLAPHVRRHVRHLLTSAV